MEELVDVALLLAAVVLLHGGVPLYLWKPHARRYSLETPRSRD